MRCPSGQVDHESNGRRCLCNGSPDDHEDQKSSVCDVSFLSPPNYLLKTFPVCSSNKTPMCINIYDIRLEDTEPACGMNWPPEMPHITKLLGVCVPLRFAVPTGHSFNGFSTPCSVLT